MEGAEGHIDEFNPTAGYGLGFILHGVFDYLPSLINPNGSSGTCMCQVSGGFD
jgi:hypothetical protein